MITKLKRADLIYPELSYIIVGILFSVFKHLGGSLQEKHYQRAIAVELEKSKVSFAEQVRLPLSYKEVSIGEFYMDFLIEDKIVLEIKKDKMYSKRNFDQVNAYLKASKYKLAILANFTKDGLKFKRIVNIN